MIEPISMYLSEFGTYRGMIRRDDKCYWFSLHTKNPAKAAEKWQQFCDNIGAYQEWLRLHREKEAPADSKQMLLPLEQPQL